MTLLLPRPHLKGKDKRLLFLSTPFPTGTCLSYYSKGDEPGASVKSILEGEVVGAVKTTLGDDLLYGKGEAFFLLPLLSYYSSSLLPAEKNHLVLRPVIGSLVNRRQKEERKEPGNEEGHSITQQQAQSIA